MDSVRYSSTSLTSPKFYGTYDKLLRGFTPDEISPNKDAEEFFSNLLELDVDRDYIERRFSRLPKDLCLEGLKPTLNALFRSCLTHARNTDSSGGVKRSHSLDTLSVILRCLLAKNLTGWEVMEILAGGVGQSDAIFMEFVTTVDHVLTDSSAPASIRHRVLQAALIFMCGVAQLSPGAYFLRRDLFPAIAIFINSPDTEQFTFEAVLLLVILANFHKSDAAKLNPYLQSIRETKDKGLMRKICWAANYAIDASVKAYQEILNDSPPSLTTSLNSMIASLRPDRALASTPVDPPRELFKNQPIEAAVALLPIFEFLRINSTFAAVFLEYPSRDVNENNEFITASAPPFTVLTLSSYILAHATSTSSPRSIAYANLCLNLLLLYTENDDILNSFCQPIQGDIRLCRQRPPALPLSLAQRPPICALLDCCVLWLRHNLHKRLEVYLYRTCIDACYRVLRFFIKGRIRLEYDWREFWRAILGLLNFLSTKLDSLSTMGGVERLSQKSILLLGLALYKSETFLPTAQCLHEFIYELIRSSSGLKNQMSLLDSLALPRSTPSRRTPLIAERPTEILTYILKTVEFYEQKVGMAGARTAKEAMRVVAREIERDGLHCNKTSMKDLREMEEMPKRSEDILGFARFACMDGLSLMP